MQSLHPQSAWITYWTLQHACKVIRPGRSFLHRAISLLSIAKWPHHHIRLNHGFESDLMWWKVFSTYWNGASLLVDPNATPQVVLTSDDSGSWGCGTWCRPRWFQLQWDNSSGLKRITEKDLFPIIIAVAIWGQSLGGHSLGVNRWFLGVITQQLSHSHYSWEDNLMQLLRCLFFVEAHCQFQLRVIHLPGEQNDEVDDLSCNRLFAFWKKVPGVNSTPSPISSSLLQLLIHPHLDWRSPIWTQLFISTVQRE